MAHEIGLKNVLAKRIDWIESRQNKTENVSGISEQIEALDRMIEKFKESAGKMFIDNLAKQRERLKKKLEKPNAVDYTAELAVLKPLQAFILVNSAYQKERKARGKRKPKSSKKASSGSALPRSASGKTHSA